MKRSLSRRQFLRAGAGVGAALALPTIIPASALGRGGAVAPSERIVLGGIGLGGRGTGVLNWMLTQPDVQFVAICDVRRARREAIKQMADTHYGTKDCAMYRDLREFLAARSDIDAMLIATGDRWHTTASILAMRAGKDVYCEKPSCMTIAEGRALVDAARRYGRIFQTGTQRLSEAHHIYAIESARTGRLGRVHTAYAHIAPWDDAYPRHDWLPAEPEPPADEVDWNAWLGPCPWRPYNHQHVSGGWRGHYDFHTSCIGEWGSHTFPQAQAGLDCSEQPGIAYTYVPNTTGDGMEVRFANGARMILSRGDRYWHGSCGMRFDGDQGWLAAADGYAKTEASSPALLEDYRKVLANYTARTGRALSHPRNFFDCVKSRQRTVANPEVMHAGMTTVHCANICMWLKRDLRYDPVKEEFIGDPEANRLRARPAREPWVIA